MLSSEYFQIFCVKCLTIAAVYIRRFLNIVNIPALTFELQSWSATAADYSVCGGKTVTCI